MILKIKKRIITALLAALCVLAGCSQQAPKSTVSMQGPSEASESGGEAQQPEPTTLDRVTQAVKEILQGPHEPEGNYEPTDDEFARMQEAVAALGVPVSARDRDMANYQLMLDFCEAVKTGKDAEIALYGLYNFAIYEEHFEQKDGRLTCATTVCYYGKWVPEGGLSWKLDEFELLENGWLSWKAEGSSEYQGVRVMPLGEENRKLYWDYVEGLYSPVNGVLNRDWDENDTSGLVWEFVFESMLMREGLSIYDYPAPGGDSEPFTIPAADVEDRLTRHFPVTVQQLRQMPCYDAAGNTYRMMGFRGGGYCPRVEVTGKTENPDGSFTLEVQYPAPEFQETGTPSYLTILPDGRDGYRYLGNRSEKPQDGQ